MVSLSIYIYGMKVCLTNHKFSCTSLCLTSVYEMWPCLVWKIYCKTNCSPGGTLGVHGRNPSEGSAVSARPAECFAINTKPFVWILANHLTSYFHIHSFILSSNPLTSHFICEVSFCSKEAHKVIKKLQVFNTTLQDLLA